jgi:hypothetical protein
VTLSLHYTSHNHYSRYRISLKEYMLYSPPYRTPVGRGARDGLGILGRDGQDGGYERIAPDGAQRGAPANECEDGPSSAVGICPSVTPAIWRSIARSAPPPASSISATWARSSSAAPTRSPTSSGSSRTTWPRSTRGRRATPSSASPMAAFSTTCSSTGCPGAGSSSSTPRTASAMSPGCRRVARSAPSGM